jgi:hypothetical protein
MSQSATIPSASGAKSFSYLDRVHLGFAALTMNAELKFTPLIFFSWGAGIFFIGYFLFEAPSNLALEKFGASRWIARIMVTWGIISGLMALVSGEVELLRPTLPARRRRSRVLSRHRPLSYLLVSGRIPCTLPCRVRRARFHRDRRAGLRPPARARQRDGLERVAMAVHRRGRAIGAARPRHLALSH